MEYIITVIREILSREEKEIINSLFQLLEIKT